MIWWVGMSGFCQPFSFFVMIRSFPSQEEAQLYITEWESKFLFSELESEILAQIS